MTSSLSLRRVVTVVLLALLMLDVVLQGKECGAGGDGAAPVGGHQKPNQQNTKPTQKHKTYTETQKGQSDMHRLPDIDLTKARELLKAAVDTQGRDFVYCPNGRFQCTYAPNNQVPETGCLIGVALKIHGVSEHELSELNSLRICAAKWLLEERGIVSLSPTSAQYLQVAQDCQDLRKSWGAAYDNAEAHVLYLKHKHSTY